MSLQIWGRPNLAPFDSHYLRNTPILALLATIQDLGASRGRGNRVVAIGLRRSYIGVKAEAEVHVTKKIKVDSISWYWYFELSSFCMSSNRCRNWGRGSGPYLDASVSGLH